MNITLKNFKHYESMSEETNCFEATVYVNGKKAFTVSNHGHGGSDNYPVIYNKELFNAAEKYAKNLPATTINFGKQTISVDSDLEIVIGDLVTKKIVEKFEKKEEAKFKRMCKTKTLIFEKGNNTSYLIFNAPFSPVIKEKISARYPDCEFVNERYL